MEIIVLTNNVALAFSIAQSVYLSKLLGQKDYRAAHRFVLSSMLTMLVVSTVITAAGAVCIYSRDQDRLIIPNAIGAGLDMMVIHFVTVLRCCNFRKWPHAANAIVATVPWAGVGLIYALKGFSPIDEYSISQIYMVTEVITLIPLLILSLYVTRLAYLKRQLWSEQQATPNENTELHDVVTANTTPSESPKAANCNRCTCSMTVHQALRWMNNCLWSTSTNHPSSSNQFMQEASTPFLEPYRSGSTRRKGNGG